MCGITGMASLSGDPVDPGVLEAMNEALFHRGPDSTGTFLGGPVGLAARRLAIIDLESGDQPIANEDGSVHVVQNGEIYNFRALRQEMEACGHRFRTHGDTEVLVHLYEERGDRFPEALRGMFAIALWDGNRRRLLLARDRYGIKPLYYRISGDLLSFGSELKALMRQPGFSREIDLDALEAFLTFNSVPAPLTIFEGARKLPPGHLLEWDAARGAAGISVREFGAYRPAHVGGLRREPEAVLAEELRERLRDSVKAHLIADVPVGVMLSGGIDSSALTALAALESPGQVSTFTIGFEDGSFDERDRARLVAERYGTRHHELVVKPDAVELLPMLAEAFDEPFADSSALPTYLVSKLAREHVKVALSGEGGDELFGGYNTYVADMLAKRFGRVASTLRPLIDRLPSSVAQGSLDYKVKRFARAATLPIVERHHAWKDYFSAEARDQLLRPDRRGSADPLDHLRSRYTQSQGAEPLARLQHLDMGIHLVDDLLAKVDRTGMAVSLETRVPFLDPVVAEFALSLPDSTKISGFDTKRLLRKAIAPLLPPEIVGGAKRGFSVPAGTWLRGEVESFARDMLSPETVRRQGFFRPEAVTRLIDAHTSGRENLTAQLWALLAFSI